MLDIINIIDSTGNKKEVYLITILSSEKYKSSYIVYSEKELTEGQNEICFSKIGEENNQMILVDITDKEELNELKNLFMKEMNKNV